jgi:hypothetical protein
MTRTSLKLILALTLFALALPSAALAKKNAWQRVSLTGTSAYHATNTAPTACDPSVVNSGDGVVLSRDWKETFRADSFPSYQYAAKYFPALAGPQTNAQGQKAHLVRSGQSSEIYRTFNVDSNGACTSQDQTCSKAASLKTARFLFGVTHKNFRPGGQLQTYWNIDFSSSIPDCTPPHNDTLQRGLMPFDDGDVPSLFKAKASKSRVARKRATFTIHGSAQVKNTKGYSATVTYSGKATLKKVVIPDGCVDAHRQHAFVCSN